MDISPQMKNELMQYQQLQQQLQAIAGQRLQMEMQVKEIEKTIEELDKLSDSTTVYKSLGSIMAKADDKASVKSELEEKMETTGIRVKAIKKQEESLKERFQKLHEKLSGELQPETGAG